MFLHLFVSHSVPGGGGLSGGSASKEGSAFRAAGQDPPSDTMGYGQRAGGTYPTGMYSCSSMGVTLGVTNTLQTDALFTHAHTFCLVKMPFHQSCKEAELLACLPLHFKR